jgi:hypothetical protein
VFNKEKVMMPVPQQFARGDRMGRGPYEKSGLIEESGLHPGKTKKEHFEIFFPEDVKDLDVQVQLWYLPYGTMNSDPFLWREFKKTVSISKEGK